MFLLAYGLVVFTIWEYETQIIHKPVSISCPDGTIEHFDNMTDFNNSIFICGQPKKIISNDVDTFINAYFHKLSNGSELN